LLPDGWPPVGLFYARSDDSGQTWSAVTQLADDGFNQINVAAGSNNIVHVAWNGMAGIHGRYYRWSADGGMTWSETTSLNTAGTAGSSGNPPLVVDSLGTTHLLVIDAGCVLYLYRQINVWSEPDCISSRAVGASDWIETPDMTIVGGNQLYVVFWDNRERLWYMTRQLDAPSLLPALLPTTKPTSLPTETSTPTTPPTQERAFLPGDGISTDSGKADAFRLSQPVFLAVLPALLIVVGTISIYSAVKKRRQ
jgi:hypothetical protein